MQGTIRLLAGVARPGSRLKPSPLNLEQFLIRQRVLSLWRDILRSTKRIPNSSTKHELRSFARGEFERHRNVTDAGHIRYLLSTGKTEFDTMRRYIDEQIV
ncbi:hypothetical protein MGYG_02831 [Nannizzia gypsea CBS 118893]|uniref:LYR motif-containing protein 2 n=1 Tax=Arthroderma gypseum (strain ATCC MYA-4604 / CBS 118893) TaxID=535722 RepID=E4UP93_ARTGP|nr:hypothetical protein MGYG_02831 [Nannizzia gypsea CBS 118893]EFQ99819.1 hypothetical protein MGYG_02831 [Nannizzia gypsea CBS 118893]